MLSLETFMGTRNGNSNRSVPGDGEWVMIVSGNRNWERGWFVRDSKVNNAARSQVTSWGSSIYGDIRWWVRSFQSLNVDK